jgi:hypothetical protein
MKRIKCQNSKCSKTHPAYENNGCGTCGGYGYVFQRGSLSCCGRSYWVRPGAFTVYNGKEYKTMDGIGLIYRIPGKTVCDECYMIEDYGVDGDLKAVKRVVLQITKVDHVKREVTFERIKRSIKKTKKELK